MHYKKLFISINLKDANKQLLYKFKAPKRSFFFINK